MCLQQNVRVCRGSERAQEIPSAITQQQKTEVHH